MQHSNMATTLGINNISRCTLLLHRLTYLFYIEFIVRCVYEMLEAADTLPSDQCVSGLFAFFSTAYPIERLDKYMYTVM